MHFEVSLSIFSFFLIKKRCDIRDLNIGIFWIQVFGVDLCNSGKHNKIHLSMTNCQDVHYISDAFIYHGNTDEKVRLPNAIFRPQINTNISKLRGLLEQWAF